MDVNGAIVAQFTQALRQLTSAKKLCVAYSGGLDSRVLLQLVVEAFSDDLTYQLSALHVHHGISPHADAWAKHCEGVCARLQVPLKVLWVDGTEREGRSPEEVAREARFKAFEAFIEPEQCLLLAHHEADQAETILLRLFRGSGPLGLGGIPEHALLGQGMLARPLLQFTKASLLDYARDKDLEWIEDDSNQNTRFDRNFLRHEIMPAIAARWPRVLRSIGRAGALCFETATAVQVFAHHDLALVQLAPEKLSVSRLLALDVVRRRGVLRCWLQNLNLNFPSFDHMERIDREILRAKSGAKPRLKISDYEVFRQKDTLCVEKLEVS